LNGIQEVDGSIPFGSTIPADDVIEFSESGGPEAVLYVWVKARARASGRPLRHGPVARAAIGLPSF
jgi:hypothetical protein